MEIEVTPEPTPEERAAIERALAEAAAQNGTPSPWWAAGLPADAAEEDGG